MSLEIELIPAFSDNYFFLLYDREDGVCGVVDPGDAAPVLDRLGERALTLTHILNTHHHSDHTGANLALKDKTGATIVGPRAEAARIPGIETELGDGDTYAFGSHTAQIFDVPGHTAGHIAWWFEEEKAAFVGDTLFALGCGRLFEGSAAQMWASLSKLMALPDDTRVFCAHEYTQANARFAVTVEPHNEALLKRAAEIDAMRKQGLSTVPTTIGLERATNPFVRPQSADLQETLGLSGADPVAVFAETRARKDSF